MASTNAPTLQATVRDPNGSPEARRMRTEGMVPAVCYGHKIDNTSIALDPKEFDKIVETPNELNTVFSIELDDGETFENIMLRDYQIDPLSRELMHADFVAIDPEQPIRVEIPLEGEGEAEGVKMGGRLQYIRRTVAVLAPPAEIPEKLTIDVSHLTPDDAIMADDLEYPENVEPAHSIDYALIRIQMPREELEVVTGPETTAAVTPTTEEGEELEEGEVPEGEEEDEGPIPGAQAPGA